ncbi:HNH endonuclease [Sorangium atrum]|uniref:HNH endonuclease signature motif containing protein n=1 Tax=Sorangium atrum TaxID=2995308 RepID=A0ABT5C6A8_9BACT|nr:HNH endonuclease signature motif containing protein [Sorangium aterium]MDC0681956.1 HNH endonuclease signature motif containing protein [Sorangium aterium]
MSRDSVPAALQRRVRKRAADRCEYCRLSQVSQEAAFHVDHIQPRHADGLTTPENLALACVSCSLRKGARTHGEDPSTGDHASLFHPRWGRWEDHLDVTSDLLIAGKTPTGRATVARLRMNRPLVIEIRREEALRGRFP